MLGKVNKKDPVSADMAAVVLRLQPNAQFNGALSYNRLLLNGIVYSSSSYKRTSCTDDSILIFEDDSVGQATAYISCSGRNCDDVSCTEKCYHIVVVNLYNTASKRCHIYTAGPLER